MVAAEKLKVTYSEYVKREETSDIKHEFLNGEVFAMAGGTPEHALLISHVHVAIANALRDPCRVFASDLRVRTASGLGTYPDVAVVCGKVNVVLDDACSVTNPTLLVEVLSDSTEDYDRGKKFDHYRTVSSLKECAFVSHRSPLVEVRLRNADGSWTTTFAGAGESIRLRSVDVQLDVDSLYRGLIRDDGEERMRLT